MNPTQRERVIVFIDYWNFQLTLNDLEAEARGLPWEERALPENRFKVDWKDLGYWLAKEGCETAKIKPEEYSFEGVHIYASFNPYTEQGRVFKKWATTWLDRQPGVMVHCMERVPKSLPKCPSCHREIEDCPHCAKRIVATSEKGVDTLIATDMIRLAWEDAFDLAILASSDRDLVPAVSFLATKARKIIQAGFPPRGVDLATECWASFDVFKCREEIRRPDSPGKII